MRLEVFSSRQNKLRIINSTLIIFHPFSFLLTFPWLLPPTPYSLTWFLFHFYVWLSLNSHPFIIPCPKTWFLLGFLIKTQVKMKNSPPLIFLADLSVIRRGKTEFFHLFHLFMKLPKSTWYFSCLSITYLIWSFKILIALKF